MSSADFRRPVSVLVLVYTDNADVLLLKRVRPFVFWQSVTGSLNDDETAADAARRELHEETGLTTEGRLRDTGNVRTFEIDTRWRYRFPPGITENQEFEWHFQLASPVDVVLDQTEHSSFKWCPIEQAIEKVWSWTNKEALMQLQSSL
jgi:dATP pyrophosphohydrolase